MVYSPITRNIFIWFLFLFAQFPCKGLSCFSTHFTEGTTQVHADTILANQYFNRAVQYSKLNQFDSAQAFFEQALNMYIEVEDWSGIVRTHNGLGYNFRDQGQFDRAMEHLGHALEMGLEKLGASHHEVALTYFHIGKVFRRKDSFDSSLHYYRKALDIDVNVLGPDHSWLGRIYLSMGMAIRGKFEYDSALVYMYKALQIWTKNHGDLSPNHGAVFTGLSIVYRAKQDYEQALKYANKSLDVRLKVLPPGHRSLAASYTALGNIHADRGNYDFALECYGNSLKIELETYGEMHPYVASDFLRIGIMHFDKHNFDWALDYYRKALQLKQQLFGSNSSQVARIYDRIGNAYRAKGEHSEALIYFQRSLDIKLEIFGPDHLYVADSYFLVGRNFRMKDSLQLALDYLEKGLTIREKLKGFANYSRASFYHELGHCYRELRAFDQAQKSYRKALKAYQEVYVDRHVYMANIYHAQGLSHLAQGDYNQALSYYEKAITNLGVDLEDGPDKISGEDVFFEHELLYILNDKALTLEKKYEKSNVLKDLQLASETFMLNLKLIDDIKRGFRLSKSKLNFAKDVHRTYEGAMRTGWQLYQLTGEKSLLHQLFTCAEKSKASGLREALNDMQAKRNAGIPNRLLMEERTLKADLSYYEAQIASYKLHSRTYDTMEVRAFQNRFFELSRRYDTLLNKLESEYPRYYRLKYNTDVASIPDVQKILPDPGAALIEYFVGTEAIYIFKITKTNTTVRRVPKPVDFHMLTTNLRQSLADYVGIKNAVIESYDLYSQSSHQLYELLLKEELAQNHDEISSLIIVPDETLGHIPFESLLTHKVPTETKISQINYQNLPYLLYQCNISYSYSATLMLENSRKAKPHAKNECLAFAPFDNRDKSDLAMSGMLVALRDMDMQSLPGASREVQELSKFVKGDFRFGPEAGENIFKQEAEHFRILHLAMHGISDDKNPSNSRLIFNTKRDGLEDNQLFAYELYNMTLNAEMVVLSACQTGSGQFQQGEGVMSLARAFMYAGSQSVLQTLWNTEDQSSASMMAYFYEGLSSGLDKASALRQAKLKYLESGEGHQTNPFYWAGFTIYGDMAPIELQGQRNYMLQVLIVLFAAFFIGWFFRYKARMHHV